MAIIYIYIFTLTDLVKEKSTINWSDIIIYIFWKLKLNSVTQITIVNSYNYDRLHNSRQWCHGTAYHNWNH